MALTVRDIMDADPVSVTVADSVETVLHGMRDLVLTDENEDFHLPHYFELFGGIVFLERWSHFEERARKAFAAHAEEMMTENPVTIEPDATVREAAGLIARRKHNRIPVVEHGRLVGVVTRVDV